MTEQNPNDKQLNDYLSGKSALSDQYQRLHADQPSSAIDTNILQAAKAEISITARKRQWTLPVTIAAMLLIGMSVLWWQQYRPTTVPNNTESAAPSPDNSLPSQVDRSLHNNPTADQWLNRILILHDAGKTAEAAAEFKKFRQAYPAYSIDQQRFGALQQYDR